MNRPLTGRQSRRTVSPRSRLCRHRRCRPPVAVAPFRAGSRASACVPRGPVVCALLAKGRGTGRRTPRPFSRPPDAVAASSPLGLACTRPASATAQDAWLAVCAHGDYGRPLVKRRRMLLSWRRGAARRLPVPVLAPRCCQAVAVPLVPPATALLPLGRGPLSTTTPTTSSSLVRGLRGCCVWRRLRLYPLQPGLPPGLATSRSRSKLLLRLWRHRYVCHLSLPWRCGWRSPPEKRMMKQT